MRALDHQVLRAALVRLVERDAPLLQAVGVDQAHPVLVVDHQHLDEMPERRPAGDRDAADLACLGVGKPSARPGAAAARRPPSSPARPAGRTSPRRTAARPLCAPRRTDAGPRRTGCRGRSSASRSPRAAHLDAEPVGLGDLGDPGQPVDGGHEVVGELFFGCALAASEPPFEAPQETHNKKVSDYAGGVSTITVVAFTTATASEPGSRPSSRTASADMSETTRWGPA